MCMCMYILYKEWVLNVCYLYSLLNGWPEGLASVPQPLSVLVNVTGSSPFTWILNLITPKLNPEISIF